MSSLAEPRLGEIGFEIVDIYRTTDLAHPIVLGGIAISYGPEAGIPTGGRTGNVMMLGSWSLRPDIKAYKGYRAPVSEPLPKNTFGIGGFSQHAIDRPKQASIDGDASNAEGELGRQSPGRRGILRRFAARLLRSTVLTQ